MNSSKSEDLRKQRSLSEMTILQKCEELNRKYKTTEDCFEAIYRSLNNGKGLVCRNCDSRDFEKKYGARVGKCKKCRIETHFTANTIYEDCRNPRPYLAANYLLAKGVIFNASQLARATQIATSTAAVIYKKIQLVLIEQISQAKNVDAVDSSWFVSVMAKRSTRTPDQQHPAAEQAAFEQELKTGSMLPQIQGAQAQDDLPNRELTKDEQTIWDLLGTDRKTFDTLLSESAFQTGQLSSLLIIMELDGVLNSEDSDCYSRANSPHPQNSKALPNKNPNANGGRPPHLHILLKRTTKSTQAVNPSPPYNSSFKSNVVIPSEEISEEIIATITRIKANFHGIARKYLQPYLAVYWCVDSRKQRSFTKLLKACGKHGSISTSDIKAYVTPLLVSMKRAA